jgi:hypothetical protein
MTRSTRRLAAAAMAAAAIAVPAATAHADGTAVLTATTVAGTLSVTGVGTATGNATPGGWSSLTGATALVVSDLRASTAGWHVTAQFSAPVAPTVSLGGANVRVTTGNAAGDALNNVTTFSNVTLGSPATVLNTYGGGGSALNGAGITTADASYAVQLPTTATLGTVYGGTITYTVSTG